MRNQTASSHPAQAGTGMRRAPRARRQASLAKASATPFAIPTQAPDHIPARGALPSYCDRKPAAVLDDGWVGESLEVADDLDTMDAYDDFFEDSGDIEDSR